MEYASAENWMMTFHEAREVKSCVILFFENKTSKKYLQND